MYSMRAKFLHLAQTPTKNIVNYYYYLLYILDICKEGLGQAPVRSIIPSEICPTGASSQQRSPRRWRSTDIIRCSTSYNRRAEAQLRGRLRSNNKRSIHLRVLCQTALNVNYSSQNRHQLALCRCKITFQKQTENKTQKSRISGH